MITVKNFLTTVCVAHPAGKQHRRQKNKFFKVCRDSLNQAFPNASLFRLPAMKSFLQDVVHMGTHLFPWLEQEKDAMAPPFII